MSGTLVLGDSAVLLIYNDAFVGFCGSFEMPCFVKLLLHKALGPMGCGGLLRVSD
jgi:hypothetical protein